jgi:predicted hydrocarbon binding protein
MAKEPRLKASVVNPGMSFISTSLGEATLNKILASFDSQEITRKRLLPSDWVGEETYRNLLVATRRYLESTPGQKAPKEFFFEMGRFAGREGINKYYKSLIRIFDTKFMLTRATLIWGLTHSHGSVKVEPLDKGAYVYVHDFPAPSKEFCYTMSGYMYTIGELTKADMIRVEELECVTEGAKRCKFIGEWK